jgi:hypothetical protein
MAAHHQGSSAAHDGPAVAKCTDRCRLQRFATLMFYCNALRCCAFAASDMLVCSDKP